MLKPLECIKSLRTEGLGIWSGPWRHGSRRPHPLSESRFGKGTVHSLYDGICNNLACFVDVPDGRCRLQTRCCMYRTKTLWRFPRRAQRSRSSRSQPSWHFSSQKVGRSRGFLPVNMQSERVDESQMQRVIECRAEDAVLSGTQCSCQAIKVVFPLLEQNIVLKFENSDCERRPVITKRRSLFKKLQPKKAITCKFETVTFQCAFVLLQKIKQGPAPEELSTSP